MENNTDKIISNLDNLKKESPEYFELIQLFKKALKHISDLDSKVKDLINVALSICAQCQWCIVFHVKGAFARGATRAEIIDAASMAVLMHGGPALMYMIPLMEALKEFDPKQKAA